MYPPPTDPTSMKPDPGALCGTPATVTLPTVDLYPVLHARGDTELDGNANVSIKVEIQPTHKRLAVTYQTTVVEQRRPGGGRVGRTSFSKTAYKLVDVPVPVSCRIKSVTPVVGRGSDSQPNSTDIRTVHGTGLLDKARCRMDTMGSDANEVGCKDIKPRTVEVTFESDTGSCQDITLDLPTTQVVGLKSTGGDGDMDGRPEVEIDSAITHDGDKATLKLDVRVAESGGVSEAFVGSTSMTLLQASKDFPRCKIVGVTNDTGRIRGRVRRDNYYVGLVFGGSRSGVQGPAAEGHLRDASCVTSLPRKDHGKLGCAEIRSLSTTIELAPKS